MVIKPCFHQKMTYLTSRITQQLETEMIMYAKNEAKYHVHSLRKSLAYNVRRVPKVISSSFL